jgi:tRNA threonylcarbamoyladenosine biosynthesis protein TsaB
VIVAFEGASTELSVAAAEPDGTLIADAGWRSAQRQSAELLPELLVLLRGSGRDLHETTAVAVGIGPGSFTGLRVSLSLAKGLGLALGVPIVGIPSLEAWLAAEPSAAVALARAGAHEAYLLARGERDPVVVDRDGLPEMARTAPVVAPGELAEAFGLSAATSPRSAARVLAGLAAERLRDDPGGDDLATLEPRYLRPPRGLTGPEEGRVKWL